jgi:hypothetical protein
MDWGWIAFAGHAVLDFVVLAAWSPYLASYMGEKGKRLGTKEDIEHVLDEVRLVTAETETIKASISGDLWNRQMVHTEKCDLYVQVLRILGRLADRYAEYVVHITPTGATQGAVEPYRQILDL